MSDYTELRVRVLTHLKEIAPKSTSKEKMRNNLLMGLDVDGNDLAKILKELWREKWVFVTYGNYFYITDERIKDYEKTHPGYSKEVEFFRSGGKLAVPTATTTQRNGLKPFDNDWCKAMIEDEQARKEFMTHIDYRDIEVFRLIIKMWYEKEGDNVNFATMPPVTDRPCDMTQADRYAKKLRHYYDWTPFSKLAGE